MDEGLPGLWFRVECQKNLKIKEKRGKNDDFSMAGILAAVDRLCCPYPESTLALKLHPDLAKPYKSRSDPTSEND